MNDYGDMAHILLDNAGRTPRADSVAQEIAIAEVRALRGIGYAILNLIEELHD